MGRYRSRSRERRRTYSRSSSRSDSRSRSNSPSEESRVHVADLGIDPSRSEIVRCFERYGRIVDLWLARNPPCFAFIVYRYRDEAENAIKDMDGKSLSGGRIRVSYARPRTRGRRRRGYDPNLRCYQCGESGHFSRDCADVWRRMRRDGSRERSSGREREPRVAKRRQSRRSRSKSRSRSRSNSPSRSSKKHSRKHSRSSRSRTKSRSPRKSASRESKSRNTRERDERKHSDDSPGKRSASGSPQRRSKSPVPEANGSEQPKQIDEKGDNWSGDEKALKDTVREVIKDETDAPTAKWEGSPGKPGIDLFEGRWADTPSPAGVTTQE